MEEAYFDAGVPIPDRYKKRNRAQQRKAVTDYIKSNPACTVTDIRKHTGVCIHRTFGTISNAYLAAGKIYAPRTPESGVMSSEVIKRSREFEKTMLLALEKYGAVQKKVFTGRGFADGILSVQNQRFVIEIKDFRASNNITQSQLKQLFSYMQDLRINTGILICPATSIPGNKQRYFYKDNKTIHIVTEQEIRGHSLTW